MIVFLGNDPSLQKMLGSEEVLGPNQIRSVMKPLQEKGVAVAFHDGEAQVTLPEGITLTPHKKNTLRGFIKQIAPELSGIKPQGAKIIVSALESFQNRPAFVKDMVMYGPSLENDYATERMARLNEVRQAVTQAQMTSQPGRERISAVKAATFTCKHLPDLGLKTTASVIRAVSEAQ